MITIYVHKTQARAELDAPVTSGSVGREMQFQFSDDWDGLVKTAVFETNNYKETATVPESGTLAIPEDVLTYPGFQLRIGVIGKTADGATVIPTVYADCSMIKPGASTVPVGTPPTPSQAEQLQAQINALVGQIGGLSSNEKLLVLSLFKNAAYTADMSATISQLETLWSGEDVPDEPDVPVVPDIPEADVSQSGSILSIVSGVSVSQSGAILSIA